MERRVVSSTNLDERKGLPPRMEEKEDAFDEQDLEEGVKSTKALIQTFLQTLKAYRLYESNHPILSKFLDRIKKDFEHYFSEFDSFSLQVGEHRLFYRGKVVYESEDVKESLAFFFFKDGIREIRFFKGLEFKEIMDFLSVVRKGDFVNRLEDDLVTLLWEKDFSHIIFTTVDEFIEGSGNFIPATEDDLVKRLEFRNAWEEGLREDGTKAESQEDLFLVAKDLRQAINPSPGQSLVEACQLAPEEIEAIHQEAQQEEQREYVYVLINNLIEILLHLGEDIDAYENMISYFERVLHSLLEQNEVDKVVAILKDLNDTMESMVLKDKQIFAIRRIIESISTPSSVELLGKVLKSSGEIDPEMVLQYLRLMTKKAADPLCLLLGELESGKWRKVICDVLAEICKEDIQGLTRFLSDSNPFVICHILYILGKIGHPSALKHVGSLVTHEDPKVRDETLQMLSRFGDKGKDLVQKMMRDPSPGIRTKACSLLAKTVGGKAVRPLLEIILSEQFLKRNYEEKAAFFKALGETGSKEAIPELKKIAKKGGWFQRAKWKEMRLCATHTLRILEGTEKGSFPGTSMKASERSLNRSPD